MCQRWRPHLADFIYVPDVLAPKSKCLSYFFCVGVPAVCVSISIILIVTIMYLYMVNKV